MDRVSCPRCSRDCLASFVMLMASPAAAIAPRWNCLNCGLAWSEHDPAQLRLLLRERGGELARQFLDELDHGPMRDLPDTAAARLVATKVAGLDHHARCSPENVLVRKCREVMGVTWDEAIAAARTWRDLSRAEKLARLGWVAKKAKEPIDDLAEPLI